MAKLDSEFNIPDDLKINSTLVLAGYFLAIMFILNVAFGNAIMNVIAFGLPVNEMMIGFFLILLSITGHLKIPTGNATIFLYIWLALGLLLWLPFGFFKYGIIAGRDATQLLDQSVIHI